MAAREVPVIGQAWAQRSVVTFHGQHDTHIDTGEEYPRLTLGEIFTMEPGREPKASGHAFIPSTYHEYDARSHKTQRESGEFVTLAADIDKGNHPLKQVQSIVSGICRDAAWLIYASAHACPGDMRWRVIIPLAEPLGFDDWNDAQNALFNVLDRLGNLECDRALQRAAQPVYLPNVPPTHAKTGEPLRDDDGKPRFYERASSGCGAPALDLNRGPISSDIASIKQRREAEERERLKLRAEADRRRAERPHTDGGNIIDEFNRANPIDNLLTLYGYTQCPRNGDDWRSPMQTGESYATRVMGDTWVSLSGSDAGAGLGAKHAAGCYGDAYDLFLHFEHGGDHKAAFRQLYAERRAAQPLLSSPPPAPEGDPGWTDLPDGPDEAEDVLIEPVLEEAEVEPGRFALPLEWAGDAEPAIDGFWLIDEWLPTQGIAAIYGHPGCGKSFFALHMAAHVASGREWAGRRVEQGLVVYVVAEGSSGFRNRMFAMRQSGEIAPDAPLAFIPTPIDMQAQDGDVRALIATIKAAAEVKGMKPAMIVLDTLSKTFGAGKENTDDMVAYINNCQRVATAFDCLTCVIHHRPKDQESRDLRGHSSLRGNVDTTILVEAGEIKTATTLKQKDGEDNIQIRFRLNRVVIGIDRNGIERSTCLVELTDEAPSNMDGVKLSPAEIEALQALQRTIATKSKEWNFGGTFDVLECCYQSDWRRQLEQDGTMGWDNSETARKRWQRTRNSLIKKGLTVERDGYTAFLGTGGT